MADSSNLKCAPVRLMVVTAEPAAILEKGVALPAGVELRVSTDDREIEQLARDNQIDVAFVVPGNGISKPALRSLLDVPSVKWISNAGAGVEHLAPWDESRVTVTNAAGVLSDFLAEYTISALQMANIGFPSLKEAQRQEVWDQRNWTPIAGKTIAIVGLGHVGRSVAKKAKALDMRVIGSRATAVETENVDQVFPTARLHNMLAQADFVSIHAAETPETRGIIDDAAFACMNRGTILLNAARGPLVVEKALLKAVDSGKIECAILDVFDQEPPESGHPYWSHPRIVMTPHMADLVPDWEIRMFKAFLENLGRFRRGEDLLNIVSPTRGY